MQTDETRDRQAALERLMAQYGTALLRMCCLYLRDYSLAEDAVQETFLKAYARLDTFRGDCSEQTWLMKIAINTCRDMHLKRLCPARCRRIRQIDHLVTAKCCFIEADGDIGVKVTAPAAKATACTGKSIAETTVSA